MSKKLISLVLVLAISSIASAGTLYWNSNVASGDWNVASNWKTTGDTTGVLSTAVPGTGDSAMMRTSLNGTYTSVTIAVSTTDAVCNRVNINAGTETINIQTGAVLTNNGGTWPTAVQIYNTGTATLNVSGTWKNERAGTAMSVKIGGGASGTPNNTINILNGGIVTAKAGGLATFAIGNTGLTVGKARVNIASGGLLDVDAYVFGSLADKKMQIYTGGLMKVLGNATTQIQADITAGNIVGPTGTTAGLGIWQSGGYTYVPEPATVALLGLGSLMLLKRKR